MILRRYKISFFANDGNPIVELLRKPIHDNVLILTKIVYAIDRKSVEKIAKGHVYEWLYEEDNEIADKLEHPNCKISWEIQCIRQSRC